MNFDISYDFLSQEMSKSIVKSGIVKLRSEKNINENSLPISNDRTEVLDVRTYAAGTNSRRGVAVPHDNLNQTKHIGILGRFSC